MIVCSCNVFSRDEVQACLGAGGGCPRTPAQVHRCLGCSPQCGACARTIRGILSQAGLDDGCGGCCRDDVCCGGAAAEWQRQGTLAALSGSAAYLGSRNAQAAR